MRTAPDTAMMEITKKTDLKIAIESLERSKHRRVTEVTFFDRGESGAKRVTEPVKLR